MKKHIFTAISLFTLIGLAAVSCDTIDENERFVNEYENLIDWNFRVTTDTITIDEETWNVQRAHRLLIEDYTGYLCVNCPTMADFIESSIVESIDSLAIVVGMHMNGNSLSTTPAFLNLSTLEAQYYGETLAGRYSSEIGLPSVAIDRLQTNDNNGPIFSGTTENTLTTVSSLAYKQYKRYNSKESDSPNINLAANITSTDSIYTLSTLVLSDAETTLPLKLQLWVIEDGIIGIQQMSSGIGVYTHNHVFRSSVNGTWGESISLDATTLSAVTHHTLTLDAAWKAENCSVVAFVYRDDTKEVLNAVKVGL
jgi:hypothetical protein